MHKEKKCTKCNQIKRLAEYYKRKDSRDGHYHWCKACHAAKCLAWARANPDKTKNYRDHPTRKARARERSRLHRETPRGKFLAHRSHARACEHVHTLTQEEFSSITAKPCFYCHGISSDSGMDRKDSSKGYTIENVVPCCRTCNSRKSAGDFQEYVAKVKLNEHGLNRCRSCEEVKPFEEFYKGTRSGNPNAYHRDCKACYRAKRRKV